MDDACHIGVDKLYLPFCSVFGAHGAAWRGTGPRPTDMNDIGLKSRNGQRARLQRAPTAAAASVL